jgi:uncharacterized membrane protein YphA (DoxX/SURF4 family)
MLAPEAWLALLRVVAGAWFLKAVWTKLALGLAWGVLPYPTVSARFIGFHPKRVAEFAAGNPIGWYKDFLEQTVLPNAALFATLQVWGEVAVGIGLTLGFLTRLTALGRPLSRGELRAREPMDELRSAGLPPPPRDVDGDLHRRGRRPRVGPRRATAPAGRTGARRLLRVLA